MPWKTCTNYYIVNFDCCYKKYVVLDDHRANSYNFGILYAQLGITAYKAFDGLWYEDIINEKLWGI